MEVLEEEQQRALQVAQFLSSFQSFYGVNPSVRKGPISVEDLERAIRYRQQLHDHYELSNEVRALNRDGHSTAEQLSEWDQALAESQARMDVLPAADREVHDVVRRFEVWSTKALTQQVLVHCAPARKTAVAAAGGKSSEHICGSPLLNLPGAHYFSNIFPPLPAAAGGRAEANDDTQTSNRKPRFRVPYKRSPSSSGRRSPTSVEHIPCSLPITPNAYTWSEFARISDMVTRLPGASARREALTSSLTAASPMVFQPPNMKRHNDLKMSENSQLTQADLVALWVRAQRNTGALLHLLQLFHVRPAPHEEENPKFRIQGRGVGGKVLVRQPDDSEEEHFHDEENEPATDDTPKYVAYYVGNHKWTRNAVDRSSPKLDELIEWAVTNQFLFTDPQIRSLLAKEGPKADITTKEKSLRKRPRSPDGQDLEEWMPKRWKSAEAQSKDLLRFACETYVLRWFARRNRHIVSVLFSSEPKRCKAPFYQSTVRHLVSAGVVPAIKRIMKLNYNSQERTLARIDRRTHIAYFQSEEGVSTFRDAVVLLLRALETATEDREMDVASAVRDFEALHEAFVEGKEPAIAAAGLLELHEKAEESQLDLLKAVPSPWIDRCAKCDQSIQEDNFMVCAYCESVFHLGCDKGANEMSLSEVISSYPPLAQLCAIEIPADCTELLPDFRENKMQGLAWSQLELNFNNRVLQDGKLSDLESHVRHTEECERTLEQIQSGSVNACMPLAESYPLAVERRGAIIVKDGFSAVGLKQSDVITEVRLDDVTGSGNTSSPWCDLASLSMEERMAFLMSKVTKKLTVRVQRPNFDLVSRSSQWLRTVRKANRKLWSAFKDDKIRKLWCCSSCQSRPGPVQKGSRVHHDAACCRAVIRRLGMESFALPFQDEMLTDTSSIDDGSEIECASEHSHFVSLRRLDAMFDCIASGQAGSARPSQHSAAFFVPPWVTAASSALPVGTSDRLLWAPSEMEDKPFDLLCRGMVLLVSTRTHHTQEQRVLLLCHFARLFSAWCLGTGSLRIGPPPVALFACQPWLVASCTACCVVPKKVELSKVARSVPPLCTCGNHACKMVLEKYSFRSDGADENGELNSLLTQKESNIGTERDELKPRKRPLSSRIDISLRSYDRCTALVGTSLLVLPGDPLLLQLAKSLNQSIDHEERPVVMVVASYLPSQFSGEVDEERDLRSEGDGGVFHILPVMSFSQLQFLLDCCRMRKSLVSEVNGNDSWTKLDVLELPGVIRMTEPELMSKLKETWAIRQAVDTSVALYASCSDATSLESLRLTNETLMGVARTSAVVPCDAALTFATGADSSGEEGAATAMHAIGDFDARCSDTSPEMSACPSIVSNALSNSPEIQAVLSRHSRIIENLLQSETPFVRDMIDASDPSSLGGVEDGAGSNMHERESDTDIEDLDGHESKWRFRKRRRLEVDPLLSQLSQILRNSLLSTQQVEVWYTDFFVESTEGTQALNAELRAQTLTRPQSRGENFRYLMFLMDGKNRADSSVDLDTPQYAGVGWGLELVRWDSEKLLRVGRVHPNSPASRAGIRMHDIVATIDGIPVVKLKRPLSVISAVLKLAPRNSSAYNGMCTVETSVAIARRLSEPVSACLVLYCYRQIPAVVTVSDDSNQGNKQNTNMEPARLIDLTNSGNGVVQSQEQVHRPMLDEDGVREQILDNSTFLGREHLYSAGLRGTVLTCVESAVLRESITRHSPKLGCRLLIPRYNSVLAERLQLYVRSHRDAASIPRIDDQLWQFILRSDYYRSQGETGPSVVQENGYNYRRPIRQLPLDRMVEDYFHREYNNPDLLERIRGGGRVSPQSPLPGSLTQLPKALWKGQFVKGECMIKHGPVAGEASLIGHVENLVPDAEDKVTVSVFYVSGHGLLEESRYYDMEASSLHLVEVGSADYSFVERWQREVAERQSIGNGQEEGTQGLSPQSPLPGSLTRLPKEIWKGQFVKGECMIKQGPVAGEASLIGHVENLVPDAEDKVTVSVFYVSGHGLLEESQFYDMEASSLHLVEVGSPDYSFVERWQRENWPLAERQSIGNGQEEGTHGSFHSDLPDSESISIEEAGSLFLKRLCSRGRGEASLGNLPDGRSVFWIPSDPLALYVQTTKVLNQKARKEMYWKAQVSFGEVIGDVYDWVEKFYCPWGCSNPRGKGRRGRAAIPYSTESDLASHLFEAHSFAIDAEDIRCGPGKVLTRMSEGEMIVALGSDLSNSICRLLPAIAPLTSNVSPRQPNMSLGIGASDRTKVTLIPTEVLNLTKAGRGAPRQIPAGPNFPRERKSELMRLIHLWSRIARLFDVEGRGKFRFSIEECFSHLNSIGGQQVSRNDEKDNNSPITNACLSETWMDDSLTSESLQCRLCSVTGKESHALGSGSAEFFRPLGCSLYTECFGEPNTRIRASHFHLHTDGFIGVGKAALIHLASAVPENLKRSSGRQPADPDQTLDCIWDVDNLMIWRKQVGQARNTQTLARAFLVLVRSVRKSELPRWWRGAREGWMSTLAVSALTSPAALLLHLYVFDLAVSEYASTSHSEPAPQSAEEGILSTLEKMTIEKRMETVVKWGLDLGNERYTGESDSTCIQCDEGGTLLCCEFCKNVSHPFCCDPPILDSSTFDWVCDACVNDFAVCM